MKLQTKFALFNMVSKILIVGVLGALLPIIVNQVVYSHMDDRLVAKMNKVLKIIEKGGLQEIKNDEDCSYGNYNLLKEEFINVTAFDKMGGEYEIINANRKLENEETKYRILSKTFVYDNQIYKLEIGEGLISIKELNKTVQSFLFKIMGIVILISIVLDIGFVRYILRPLNSIIENKLKGTKHPATFDFTMHPTNTSDFRDLQQSINDMMYKIQNAFTIEKEFIANVSHELITPITILQSKFENLLTDQTLSDQTVQKIVESQQTLLRLNKIIKSLLMISRIENEQYEKADEISVREVLQEVINALDERIIQRKVSVEINLLEEFVIRNCNKTLLFNMFFNLISNAIKYNKEGGMIKISGGYDEKTYFVDIQDTGTGIDAKHFTDIFERFKRLNKNNEEGFGLGLPIAKTIANFHEIEIKVSSEVNVGSTFRLIFPIYTSVELPGS